MCTNYTSSLVYICQGREISVVISFFFCARLLRISEVHKHNQSFTVLLGICGPWICVSCCEPVDAVFPHKLLWQPIPVLSRGCVCCFSITCWNLLPTGSFSHKQYFGNRNYAFSVCTILNFALTLLMVSHPLPYLDAVRFAFHTIFNIVHSKTGTPATLILLLILIYTVCFFVWIER